MIKKKKPFFLLCMLLMFVGTLYLTGAFDYKTYTKEKSDSDPKPVHEHAKASTSMENYVAATCVKDGGYDQIDYCKCGYVLDTEHVTLKKTGHCYEETVTEITCTEAGIRTLCCLVCNDLKEEKFGEPTGHHFHEGKCVSCAKKDPDYVREWTGNEIMTLLSDSVYTNSNGYAECVDNETVNVFATEQTDCFSLDTGASYNLLGHNKQYVDFNMEELSNKMPAIYLSIGGEKGCKGNVTVDIRKNMDLENSSEESYEIDLNAAPKRIKIDLKDLTSLEIMLQTMLPMATKLYFMIFLQRSKKDG